MVDVIHFELLKQSQTIITDTYSRQMESLHAAVLKTRPLVLNGKKIPLLQRLAPYTERQYV